MKLKYLMVTNAKELIEEVGIIETLTRASALAKDYVYDLRAKGGISFSDPVKGQFPSIHVVRKTMPEAWEVISMALLGIGEKIHTHYDPVDGDGEFLSFPSLDATVMAHIEEPFSDRNMHQHFLGGWMGFGDYQAEMEGAKDHWVLDPRDVIKALKNGTFDEIREHTGWLYSYSQRFRTFPFLDIEANPQTINQLQSVINTLIKRPTSRAAQCITWNPITDHNDGQMKYLIGTGEEREARFEDYHAPCLQRLWWRLGETDEGYTLNLNTDWRSRCHLKAFPSNIYGMVEGIFEPMRKDLEDALGVPVKTGRYVDKSDSLHIYGHYLDPRIQGLDAEAYIQDIFKIAEGQPFEDRLVLPGTPMYDIMREDIEAEYRKRKQNPDFDRNL
jgi:thymidylate synthase